MANLSKSNWRKLPVILPELCIETTLRCGQSFRWKKLKSDEWSCALHGRIISLKQDSNYLYYKSTWPNNHSQIRSSTTTDIQGGDLVAGDDTEALLRHYLNLEPNLTAYYEYWSSIDSNFKKRSPTFTGVRILRQDAWEALIGFICSSNNNIIRISRMVSNICVYFGKQIGNIGDDVFYDFPTPEALAGDEVEECLRELGFGYRAGYIAKTAKTISQCKPKGWLQSLCNHEPYDQNPDQKWTTFGGREGYRNAHNQLLQLQGVGPKVADCVCLMGLGWSEAVPVDTHVLKIAQRDYKFDNGKYKTLTRNVYDAIGDHFRNLWGKEAGWAHSVLFAADLKVFSGKLSLASDVLKIPKKEKTKELVTKREFGREKSVNAVDDTLSVKIRKIRSSS